MIEFAEVMFRALTGLKLTFPTLISLAVFFAAGYYFAATTKRLNPIKAIFALLLAYIIATVLSGLLGVYTLAVVLGFLANQGVFLTRVLLWAESLAELIFVMRHRTAYEDIRQEEQSRGFEQDQAERSRPPPHKPRPEAKGQEQSKHGEKAGQSRRPGADEKEKQRKKPGQGSQQNSRSSADWKPGPRWSKADFDRCLGILELEVGKSYTQKEIKKAYRRLAMVYHPDLPTGDHDAFVRLGMASEYVMKHIGKKET